MKRLLMCLALALLCRASVAQVEKSGVYMLCPDAVGANSWVMWRGDIAVDDINAVNSTMLISCDSKYWMWVNGKMVVFEGCVKRGPNATDSYYDKIEMTPYLKKGINKIAILQWYYGKGGFSHNDSGKPVMWISYPVKEWRCAVHPSYGDTGEPKPNYRLPESNIRFDARRDTKGWQHLLADTGNIQSGIAGPDAFRSRKIRFLDLLHEYRRPQDPGICVPARQTISGSLVAR